MTGQNVCLVELSILLTSFSNLAKYNVSSGRKSPKVQKSKSHNRLRALGAGLKKTRKRDSLEGLAQSGSSVVAGTNRV